MKILAGSFQCEANTFCSKRAAIEDFEVFCGQELLDKMAAVPVFYGAGADVVPLVYASALPSGMVSREAFEFFKKKFVEMTKQEKDADGIYLYLHGSMYVEGLGSGEEYLVKAIRNVVGEEIPISIALDYHANLSDGLLRNVNAIQGFRTAPHVDHDDTERRAAVSLLKCIEKRLLPRPVCIRLPFLGGDAATTDREPFVSITGQLKELDKREGIISCAFFNGQPWYDSSYTGNSAVVSGEDEDECRQAAWKMAKTFWDGRDLLKIQNSMGVDEAVESSLVSKEKLTFVTDSGDNTTAGADGAGTLLLGKYLSRDEPGVLICGIYAEETVAGLLAKGPGEKAEIILCPGQNDPQEKEIRLNVTLKKKGTVYGWAGDEVGKGVVVSCGNTDIVLTEARAAFTTRLHFEKMGIVPEDYRVVVLKMGYLFPRLKEISENFIFALTPGISTNDFASIDYKFLKHKMYPINKDITWKEILEKGEVKL